MYYKHNIKRLCGADKVLDAKKGEGCRTKQSCNDVRNNLLSLTNVFYVSS